MKQIVIYEEDYLTRGLLQEWLSEAGYRVCSGKLRDANCQTAADLVIVSVYMPKHAGAQCVGDIKRAHPGAPLIAICSRRCRESSVCQNSGGAANTLSKRRCSTGCRLDPRQAASAGGGHIWRARHSGFRRFIRV